MAYSILVGKPLRSREYNMKLDLREMGSEDEKLIKVAQYRVKW
jgi:hypothetical protein